MMQHYISFVVDGVVGKQRPRMGRGVVYTPSKTVKYEKRVRELAKRAMETAHAEPSDGPIKIDITAVFSVPKSYTGAKRMKAISNETKPTKKPDIDNIVKSVLDGMNGVVYGDDKQVTELVAHKTYSSAGEGPHVIVKAYMED